jgi:hypothetical protein
LILEESHYFNPNIREDIICLEGMQACPPEDVGGVLGYLEFCASIKDVNHVEHDLNMEWSGGNYDRKHFDRQSVNQELEKYLRWSRNRHLD